MKWFDSSAPIIGILLSDWVLAPVAFAAWVGLLLWIKRRLFGMARKAAARTAWPWDDILLGALGPSVTIAVVASGLVVLGRILPLSPEWDRAFDVMLVAATVTALALFVDRALSSVLDRLAEGLAMLRGARGLVLGIVRGTIVGLALLVFLDSIGISVTPLLASLGVGSLAVALALQDTLANLFAGVYVIVDKPVEPGDYIRLEGGEEGFVARVGWRSTRIRTRPNNIVVVPNTKLVSSVLVNYNRPSPELAVLVNVGVHYDSDLRRVDRVTTEVAREVMQTVRGGVPTFEPFIRYHTFGDSAVQFTVILRATDFDVHNTVIHEFVMRLHERYRREDIQIPFPIRTLDLPRSQVALLRETLAVGPEAPGRLEPRTGA
jgi:small-conductance mechanosensitive channel